MYVYVYMCIRYLFLMSIIALMEKDLTLALDAAKAVKARLPLGSSAHQLYGLLCEHGLAERDFSIVYKFLNNNYNQHTKK